MEPILTPVHAARTPLDNPFNGGDIVAAGTSSTVRRTPFMRCFSRKSPRDRDQRGGGIILARKGEQKTDVRARLRNDGNASETSATVFKARLLVKVSTRTAYPVSPSEIKYLATICMSHCRLWTYLRKVS